VFGSFLEIEKEVKEVAQSMLWPFPSPAEVSFLQKVHKLLVPFGEILKRVQAEKTATICHCYGYIKALVRYVEQTEVC